MKKNWTIKTGKALAACLLAFSLAACSGTPKNEEPAAGQYKAGHLHRRHDYQRRHQKPTGNRSDRFRAADLDSAGNRRRTNLSG